VSPINAKLIAAAADAAAGLNSTKRRSPAKPGARHVVRDVSPTAELTEQEYRARERARASRFQAVGGLVPLSDEELAKRVDVEQVTYRFPLFATARDARVLLCLGTASKQALTMSPSKSLPWLLKQISALYRQKLMNDLTSDFERFDRKSFPTFVFQIAFRQKYGEAALVSDAAAALLVGCQAFYTDARVDLFARFMAEYHSMTTLHSCLKLQRALDDISLGPEYSLACNDDEVDQRKMAMLVVTRVCEAMAKRKDTTPAEAAALAALPKLAMFHSESADALQAAKAMGRGAITERMAKQWTAEQREQAHRTVPRVVVLSQYCDLLRDAAARDGVDDERPHSELDSTNRDAPYVFPALHSGEEGDFIG
jgi:hypothetical protein